MTANYLTAGETAKRIGISVSRLRWYNAQGRTPGAIKNKRGQWIYPDDLAVTIRPPGRPRKKDRP